MKSKPAVFRPTAALFATALAFAASSCTTPLPAPRYGTEAASTTRPPPRESWWKGDGVSGKPNIVISLSEQSVSYFKGGQLVGVSPISSGREGHSTPAGSYRIIEKDRNHRSSLYGAFCDSKNQIVVPDVDARSDRAPSGTHFVGAEMPCFMRITGGTGMHEGYLPGYPASHGCIRLPGDMAENFFRATPVGTPVQITGNAADAPRYEAPHETQTSAVTPARPKPKSAASTGGTFFGQKNSRKPQQPRGVTLYLE